MSEKNTGNGLVVKEIKNKRRGVLVIFDDGEKLALSQDSLLASDLHLFEGKELSEKEKEVLINFGKEDDYYSYALSLLERDLYTSHCLKMKLFHKGANAAIAASILARLEKAGLLNDEEYARNYANDISDFRLYGKNKIVAKLKEKGISDEILNTLSYPKDKELDKAERYCATLNKKLSKEANARKKNKAFRALLSRGFDSEIASKAIENSLAKTPDDVEEKSLDRDFYFARHKYLKIEDMRERKRKIFAYLARKGYNYEDISVLLEGLNDED